MDLTLSESLCGFTRVFKTLDNRNVIISTKPGEIIKHASTKQIENEGFPTHRDPFNKGRLIIIFNVEFPDSLTEANAKKIQAALPKVNKRRLLYFRVANLPLLYTPGYLFRRLAPKIPVKQ